MNKNEAYEKFGLGLTFDVPRDKAKELLLQRADRFEHAANTWERAIKSEAFLKHAQTMMHEQMMLKTGAHNAPPHQRPKPPELKDVKAQFEHSEKMVRKQVEVTRQQAALLSDRDSFFLTQEQITGLLVEDLSKYYPADWEKLLQDA